MDKEAKSFLLNIIAIGVVTTVFVVSLTLSISIPCLISEKRNIEKEITLKQMEVYGEVINDK